MLVTRSYVFQFLSTVHYSHIYSHLIYVFTNNIDVNDIATNRVHIFIHLTTLEYKIEIKQLLFFDSLKSIKSLNRQQNYKQH
jgi:hypothetical protein